MSRRQQYPIIDSHIHLFSSSHLAHLAWNAPGHPLNAAHSLDTYLSATGRGQGGPDAPQLRGFVFIETDRVYTFPAAVVAAAAAAVDGNGGTEDAAAAVAWPDDEFLTALEWPLEEFTFVSALSQRSDKVLGIVAWAPLPLGAAGVARWAARLEGERRLLKGVRFLVQDKPPGTLAAPAFVDALRWLRRAGLVFDLGIDVHRQGLAQLTEAADVCDAVMRAVPPLADPAEPAAGWVVNHLGKPDLHVAPAAVATHADFMGWVAGLRRLAAHPDVFIKLSGVFSELPPSLATTTGAATTDDAIATAIVAYVKPWARAVFEVFGPDRVLWGSDWPVCTVGFAAIFGKDRTGDAWTTWRALSERLLDDLVAEGILKEEHLPGVWAGNAERAYRLSPV